MSLLWKKRNAELTQSRGFMKHKQSKSIALSPWYSYAFILTRRYTKPWSCPLMSLHNLQWDVIFDCKFPKKPSCGEIQCKLLKPVAMHYSDLLMWKKTGWSPKAIPPVGSTHAHSTPLKLYCCARDKHFDWPINNRETNYMVISLGFS